LINLPKLERTKVIPVERIWAPFNLEELNVVIEALISTRRKTSVLLRVNGMR
jgi:hypothetical protein